MWDQMHKTDEKLLCQYKNSMFKNEIIKESSAYQIPLTNCSSHNRLYQTQKQFDNII